MHRMSSLRDLRYRYALAALCLALSLTLGCVRSEPFHPAERAAPASPKQQLPFHPDAGHVSASPAILPDQKTTGLPFKASRTRALSAGTLLTVQLELSLSAANVHPGDAFTASIAAPLVIDGETVIERGAEVTGRVEAARSRPGSGYVRLALSAITVEGAAVELQTSSLFARGTVEGAQVSSSGNPSNRESEGVRVRKGRRLTFRLTAPVTLNDSSSPDKRQSLSTSATE
jgi:hypothetical protein